MANAKRVDPRAARVEKQNDLTTESLPSIAGGVSWMLGVVSIPLLFVPPTAIITGFLAIVFGHVAKFKINRHPELGGESTACLLYTSPSPRDKRQSRMPSSA